METSEMETLITINRADLKDGFFRIYTSQSEIAKFIEDVFKMAIIGFRTTTSKRGKTTSWDFKIMGSQLPYVTALPFGIKTGGVGVPMDKDA